MPILTVTSFDGTAIRAFDSGGSGPVVVLLHGATMTYRTNFASRFVVGGSGKMTVTDGSTVVSRLLETVLA